MRIVFFFSKFLYFMLLARDRGSIKVEGGPSRAKLKPLRWRRLMCLPISALRKIGLTLISTSFLQDTDSPRAFYRRNGAVPTCMNYLFSRKTRHTRNLIELTILQYISKILFCMRKQLLTFLQKTSHNTFFSSPNS